jgi:hypothetical protein
MLLMADVTVFAPSFTVRIRPFAIEVILRRLGEGDDLSDHPAATDHVERFTGRHPVEVVGRTIAKLPQTDSLAHPVTMPARILIGPRERSAASPEPSMLPEFTSLHMAIQ